MSEDVGTGCLFESYRSPSGGDRLAFAGVYVFTLLLYVRPNELFAALGAFPVTKIVAIVTALIYFLSRLNQGRTLTDCPLELRLVGLVVLLAVLFMPVAASRQDTVDMLSDTFLKVVLIFALMINVINTRERLHSILKLMLICGVVLALGAIRSFDAGEVDKFSRIEGIVGGVFGNPNDLATWMNMLLPLAVVFALASRRLVRLVYAVFAVVLGVAVLITFSRGGFIGLMVVSGVLLWKLCRRNPAMPAVWAVVAGAAIALLVPAGYGSRLSTILNPSTDNTGSAQGRQEVLKRAVVVAARHAVLGVGMGNFHNYSLREARAHNSYLEIAAELGVAGLIAHLTLIFAPLVSLLGIELGTVGAREAGAKESYYLSVGLQGTLAAYLVCSLFASIQYQWFLYYPVACAVALRRIHGTKECESVGAIQSRLDDSIWSSAITGLIWTPRRRETGANWMRHAKGSPFRLWSDR